jgi:hypothetical protein
VKADTRRNIWHAVSASLFFSATLLFFGPAFMYYRNVSEFPFSFVDMFLSLLSLWGGIFVFFVLLSTLVARSRQCGKAVSFLFTLSFLLWLQGTVLVWDYGLLDGSEIEWDTLHWHGVVDAGIWILFLLFSLIGSRFIFQYVRAGSLMLVLVQLISLLILHYQTPALSMPKYKSDESSQFQFSSERNVIILILDSFMSGAFQEIIDEESRYRSMFKGFTYFRNCVGGYNRTTPSVPLLLTGHHYDNSVSFQSFLKNVYTADSIPRVLKKKGFDVYLPAEPYIYVDENIADNFVKKGREIIIDSESFQYLIDISLFRSAPHYLKRLIIDETSNRPSVVKRLRSKHAGDAEKHRDVIFLERMQTNAEIGPYEKAFRFYHLWGMHAPMGLNEQLEFKKVTEYTHSVMKEHTRGLLELVNRFFSTLKELEIFDNSLVVVTADHGLGTPEQPIDVTAATMANLSPLLLIKPFHSGEDLKISDAPVSLSDLPTTIFAELSLSRRSAYQYSMFDLPPSFFRVRRFLSYTRRYADHLSDLTEYHVTGHSWRIQSWQRTNRVYSFEGVKKHSEKTDSLYVYGDLIRFGKWGNAATYKGIGWSPPGLGFTAIEGEKASLLIPVDSPGSTLTLTAHLFPYPAKGVHAGRRVRVLVNGKVEGTWNITDLGVYKVFIPSRNVREKDVLNIQFEIADAASDAETGSNQTVGVVSVSLHDH